MIRQTMRCLCYDRYEACYGSDDARDLYVTIQLGVASGHLSAVN
jgi:hypothetical protein